MTVDVRAKVFCNLGTVIQASIADEALSARQGLIRCRGQVVLQGLQTPAVGSFVYFGWQRGNTIARIPRTLRVLSSFADPFRNQTTVQLGDKLVYLANLKAAKADLTETEPKPDTPDKPPTPEPQDGPAPEEYPRSGFDFFGPAVCYLPKDGETPFLFGTKDSASRLRALEPYLNAPASIKDQTALTISASSVLAKCLAALGIGQTGTTPIAQFTEDSFDLSSGYVNVIDQLLANDSLYGYLNENEVLVTTFLDSVAGSGPLITTDNLIDLTGLNQGILPGQEVTVRLQAQDLKPEPPQEPDPNEPVPDPNEPPVSGSKDEADRKRDWEYDETVSYNQKASFELATGSFEDVEYNQKTETYTYYDEDDYVIKRISKRYSILGAEAGYLFAAKIKQYDVRIPDFLRAQIRREVVFLTEEKFEYVLTGSFSDQVLDKLCAVFTARVADDLPQSRTEKLPTTQETKTFKPSLTVIGELNVSGFDWANSDLDTIPNYDIEVERVVVTYAQNQPAGQTKTTTERFIIYSNTQKGQQDIAERGKDVETTQQLSKLLQIASELQSDGVSVQVQQDRTFGVQKRPNATDRAKDKLRKDPATGSEKDTTTNTQEVTLDQQSDTTESQPNLGVDMPFGSDDGFIWTASDGFQFSGGGAAQLALRYARTQNAILRGNRNGVALQIPAYVMPLYPLSWVYLQAASVTGAYRSNGMSWAMNSDGVLCSMDALFWGGVGGSGTAWFPVAPGITSLPPAPTVSTGSGTPANAITAPGGFNPAAPGSIWSTLPAGQAPSYAKSVAPTALVPVVNEKVKLVAAIKSVLAVQALDYPLTLPTGSVTLVTKAEIQVAATLNAAATAYVFAGQDATLKRGYRLTAEAGTFIGTGFGAGSVRDYSIGTNAGTYVLDGQNAIVAFQRNPLSLEAGSFALTGQESFARISVNLLADAGSFTSSGQDARLLRNRLLTADAATFTATGLDATLTYVTPNFKIVTYTGNGLSTNAVTGVGFKPGMVWSKRTTGTENHVIYLPIANPLQTGGSYSGLTTSSTSENSSGTPWLTFDSDGFTLKSATSNSNGFVHWALCLKEGGAATTNTDGSLTTTVSVNSSLRFSQFKYDPNGGTSTIGHGLGVAPELVFIMVSGFSNGIHVGGSVIGVNNYLVHNSTAEASSDAGTFKSFGATTIGIGNSVRINRSEASWAYGYAFASSPGISKIGTFVGNGAATQAVTGLGFPPSFVMVKSYLGGTSDWVMFTAGRDGRFFANSSVAEQATDFITFNSDGFTLESGASVNTSGVSYFYLAFR